MGGPSSFVSPTWAGVCVRSLALVWVSSFALVPLTGPISGIKSPHFLWCYVRYLHLKLPGESPRSSCGAPCLCLLELGDPWSLLPYPLRARENSIPSSKAAPVFARGFLGGPLPGLGEEKYSHQFPLRRGRNKKMSSYLRSALLSTLSILTDLIPVTAISTWCYYPHFMDQSGYEVAQVPQRARGSSGT